VTPGQYFTLTFNFSTVNRSPNLEQADRSLKHSLALSIESFYQRYSIYWGGDVSELSNLIDPEDPALSLQKCARWVNKLLETAQESGDRRLANVQGVRIGYSRINSA